jgi:hypothetical protein
MRKALSVILLILFILTFPLALLFFNANRTILSPSYYKSAFTQINFYNRLMAIDPRVITNYLAEKAGTDQKDIESDPQSTEYYSHIMSMVSPDVLKMTVDNNVNQIFDVIDSGSTTMNIDLSLIKNSLNINNLSSTDAGFVNQIKSNYSIPVPTELASITTQVAKRKTSAPIYLGITLLLLLLSAILWPDWKGKLRVPGIILLIFGILIIPTSFLLRLLPMPGLGLVSIKELSSLIGDLYNNMKSQFYSLYLIEGISIFGLGLVLTIVSAFLPGNPQVAQQVAIPASPEQTDTAQAPKGAEVPKAEDIPQLQNETVPSNPLPEAPASEPVPSKEPAKIEPKPVEAKKKEKK